MIFAGVLITALKAAAGKFILPVVSVVAGNLAPILGFLRKYWRECLIVALLLAMLGTVWWKNRAISALEYEIVNFQGSMTVMEMVLDQNHIALTECVTINRQNAQAYAGQLLLAEQAVERAERESVLTEIKVERIHEDVIELRGRDEDCRTLDDPLPDWFDGWLRSDESSDPVRDH